MRPWLKLTGVSDASEKYGGDNLSDYKLSLDIEWETMLPTNMVLLEKFYPNTNICALDINVGYVFVNEFTNTPEEVVQIYRTDAGDSGSRDLGVSDQYNYLVTQQDIDDLEDDTRVELTLPNQVPDIQHLKLYHGSGKIIHGYDFGLKDDGVTIYLIPINLKTRLGVDDIINIVIYE